MSMVKSVLKKYHNRQFTANGKSGVLQRISLPLPALKA